MRFGWLGFHSEGLAAASALVGAGHHLEAVITLEPSEAAKRSGVGDYSAFCRRHGIPLHRVRSINDDASVELLRQLDLDILFVIGWSQIVGPEALASVRLGMVGAHASKLPHNRGSAPVNWAIIRGEPIGGNSLIWLAEGVDEGDLIDTREFEISLYDTCESVYEKVAGTTSDMLQALLPRLKAGEVPGEAQPTTTEPVLPRRRPSDGLVDWHSDGLAIYNFIRALTRPYPGAVSWLDGERFLLWDAAFVPMEGGVDLPEGSVVGAVVSPASAACGQAVSVPNGLLIVLEVEGPDGICLSGHDLAGLDWRGKSWSKGDE